MRYRVDAPLKIERATPAGLESHEFDAGEVEVADDSDERYALEYIALPAGVAARVAAKSKTPKE
jgi:hypothetical protein